MEETRKFKQTLILENRMSLTVDTVKNIESFNEDYLEIATELGILCIEGADLKIEHLTSDNGKILIKGSINGLFYREEKVSKKIFKGIFK